MLTLEAAVLDTLESALDLPHPIERIIAARRSETADLLRRASGFEEWLSYVSNAYFIASSQRSPFSSVAWTCGAEPSAQELEWLVSRLRCAIFSECALSLPESVGTEIPPHLPFLAKLVARDSNLGRAHLFTLNYDTLMEQALELLGIQYVDGYSGRAEARFDPSVYGLDVYYPGDVTEGRVRRFDKFLHLYKLHGSIHWYERNGEMRARHPNLREILPYRTLDPDAKSEALRKSPLGKSVGILPTANKFSQTLSMPYAHLFRSFQIRLAAPQTFLLILGYGFGDEHVNRIIENALINPSLVMLVVEPNAESQITERIRRYRDLGRRAFLLIPTSEAFRDKPFQIGTFRDFSRDVMPDVQWLDDLLRLRRFEKQVASAVSPEAES